MNRLTEMLERVEARGDSVDKLDLSKLEAVALPIDTEAVRSRLPKERGLCDPREHLKGKYQYLAGFENQDRLVNYHPLRSKLYRCAVTELLQRRRRLCRNCC